MESGISNVPIEETTWYYLKGGRQFGPVPERSVRAWLESGFFGADDLLWRAGLEEWTRAGDLPELGGRSNPMSSARLEPADSPVPAAPTTEIESTGSADPAAGPSVGTSRAAGGVGYAGLLLRVGAFVIDDLIANALVTPLVMFRMQPGKAVDVWQPDPFIAAAFIGAYLIYSAVCEASPWQATLGKRAWRIRVTSIDGIRLSLPQSFVRQLGKLLSLLGFGLGFLMCAISPRKQALHDWLSGCLVVREER